MISSSAEFVCLLTHKEINSLYFSGSFMLMESNRISTKNTLHKSYARACLRGEDDHEEGGGSAQNYMDASVEPDFAFEKYDPQSSNVQQSIRSLHRS